MKLETGLELVFCALYESENERGTREGESSFLVSRTRVKQNEREMRGR